MGINEMFTRNADLRGILNSTVPVFVSHVVHKATIEINEKLTEANAASGEIYLQCYRSANHIHS